MGLMQAAYRTYENHAHLAGIKEEGKEPLGPISHATQNAQIEITISDEGEFQRAEEIQKDAVKTLIPVTVESANRTSTAIRPHPLSDQLRYLAPFGGDKFDAYLKQLRGWAESEYTNPKLQAVLRYIEGKTIAQDLANAGLIELDGDLPTDEKIGTIEYSKCLIRWRVIPQPEGVKTACWEDTTLFDSFIHYYMLMNQDAVRDTCLITGEDDMLCETHPKGVISNPNGAKLISSNDSANFTYRGRFTTPRQAVNVGYTTSQKAHNALRWIVANHGVYMGGRTFVCWNPEGHVVPELLFSSFSQSEPTELEAYKKELSETLSGYKKSLRDNDDVVISAFDAATTGRLAVTYYNELKASDFFARVECWYATCYWNRGRWGKQSPSIWDTVNCAFGTLQGDRFKADEKVLREQSQRLLHCIIDRQPVPFDIVRTLTVKASKLQILERKNRELILFLACAFIRKYRNDKQKEEAWTLSLDLENRDRSYLFGRLLAVLEQVERFTYLNGGARETNAIRMQAVFVQRPKYAWGIIEDKLLPYYSRLHPKRRREYKDLVGEIAEKLAEVDPSELGKRLEETYLLGYYLQRSAFFRKKETPETINEEEIEDEYTEE